MITFRPATRENVGLLLGFIGPSGGGKTYTAMRVASGIAQGKPFAVIDTEARRALHYADMFKFDHAELAAPFRPQAYADAIKAADDAGYPVIVVDSCSHEHAGVGGLLEWHDEILADKVKRAGERGDRRPAWQLEEAYNMSAWIEPKAEHKKMVQRLLQVRAHLILCFRAEEKIEMVKDEHGKTKIVKKSGNNILDGWTPICEKNLPFELTASFLLLPDKPGVPRPIKLQEQHRDLFPLDKAITEESGRRIAEWARGSTKSAPKALGPTEAGSDIPAGTPSDADHYITPDQVANLETLCQDAGIELADLKHAAQVDRLSLMPREDYDRAVQWIGRGKRRKTA